MARPNLKNQDTLLIQSRIWLFGRPMADMTINSEVFARIYGYAYEGAYCDLPKPAIFLVHGEGIDADIPSERFDPNLVLLGRAPANIGRLGVATTTGSFATGMKVWGYDRADFTIRLDAETGSFESLLLEPDDDGSDPGPRMQSYGSRVRAAGALARPRRRNRGSE
jgi:hypothetical protein